MKIFTFSQYLFGIQTAYGFVRETRRRHAGLRRHYSYVRNYVPYVSKNASRHTKVLCTPQTVGDRSSALMRDTRESLTQHPLRQKCTCKMYIPDFIGNFADIVCKGFLRPLTDSFCRSDNYKRHLIHCAMALFFRMRYITMEPRRK